MKAAIPLLVSVLALSACVTQPALLPGHMEQKANEALTLRAHSSYSYVPRTTENAHSADVTVAFAVNFNTAGEQLTKREARQRYVGIPFGGNVPAAAEALVNCWVVRKSSTLNIAGNGIYTLAAHLAHKELYTHGEFAKVK